MKDRLAQFLRLERLTAVKFAEIMEVQPSSISHLLSGRNKPNFEFISRILLRFPNLNPDWIINGIGSVYKSNQAGSVRDVTSVDDSEVTKVNHTYVDDLKKDFTRIEENNLFTQANDNAAVNEVVSDVTDVTEKVSAYPAAAVSEEEKYDDSAEQEIARVVVLFHDGSFEEYHEKKKNRG